LGKLLDRQSRAPTIPPLVEGDRLTLDEYWRRYEADEEVVRAELIDGVVYVNARRAFANGQEAIASPISGEDHGDPLSLIQGWLAYYSAYTPGVVSSSSFSVRMSERTAPEPDAVLRIRPAFQEPSTVARSSSLDQLPELVVEVANSSAKRDLGPKFLAYQAVGIEEYIVWQTVSGIIDWFVLMQSKYEPLKADAEGILRSPTFPGLWLDGAAIRESDMAKVFEVLNLGLASTEHVAFAAKLRANAAKK